MATGDHDWTAGEQVNAANVDDYLMLQAVQQYATAAARDAALSARKRENMVTAQADINTLTVYSGAAWSTIGPVHGAPTAWTPVLTQSGVVTKTINRASTVRLGRYIFADFYLTATGAGTASNMITVSLPVTAASSVQSDIGSGWVQDTSVPNWASVRAILTSTTAMQFSSTASGGGSAAAFIVGSGASSGFGTVAIASGDVFSATIMYEAATDA